MIRVCLLAALIGCTPGQAQIVRNVGAGITAEGLAVGVVAHASRSQDDGRWDALWFASPLLVPGVIALVAGCITMRATD